MGHGLFHARKSAKPVVLPEPGWNHGSGGDVLRAGCNSPPAVTAWRQKPASASVGPISRGRGSADPVRFRGRRSQSGWKRTGYRPRDLRRRPGEPACL